MKRRTWVQSSCTRGTAGHFRASLTPRVAMECWVVAKIGDPPRDFMSRVLDFMMGPESYHPIEYQLYYLNIPAHAQERVAAYFREREEVD